MKRYVIALVILYILIPVGTSAQINGTVTQAEFSDDLEIDQLYKWRVENYQIGGERVEQKNDPTAFDLKHQSLIKLIVKRDPSSVNLANKPSLGDAGNLSSYFTLSYDDIEYNFESATQLYLWIFPVTGLLANGQSVNLISSFWIFNVYNILVNGDFYEFNDTLISATVDVRTNNEEYSINFESGSGTTIQAKVDSKEGLLNQLELVSGSIRMEIDRRGKGGGFLPTPVFWTILPLIAIPIFYKIVKKHR